MDVFNPNISLDPNNATGVNGSNVKTNTPDTTLGSTVNYIIDSSGIARSAQAQERATSLGLNAVAAFEGGVALGAGAQSVAIGCTSLGTNSISKVASATAVGDQAQSTACRSVALGKCANASGIDSVAIGTLAHSTSQNSITFGNKSSATGLDSIAIGKDATASGFGTIAIGLGASAAGVDAIAIGYNSSAAFEDSIGLGFGAVPGAPGSVAIGLDSTTAGANQFVAGSELRPLANVWFGQGNTVTGAFGEVAAWTLHGAEDTRADKAGGDLQIAAGRATGAGRGGSVRLQTSTTGSTGTAIRTAFDRVVIPARKSLTNNTTTELFRIGIPNPSSVAFEVKIGLSITDGTNVVSYSATANVAATHDGAGYLSTITTTGATTQLGGGGSTLAVTLSMTQPATDVMAFNIKSNTGVITPSATVCYISVIISGETTVTIV